MTNENVLLGTDLKIKVELICDGFDMLANDFVIKVKCGSYTETYEKDTLVIDEDNNFYLCLPTDNLKGLVTLVATLYVPDEDFEDGVVPGMRREVVKQDLFYVQRV